MDEAKCRAFMNRVDALSNGERAALRRACGRSLIQADAQAMNAFYRALAGDASNEWEEEAYFESACLRCMWKPEDAPQITAECALGRLRAADGGGLQRRLTALMDAYGDADGLLAVKLWRMVRLLKSRGWVIDCAALIGDIYGWNSDTRRVQRKWARAFAQDGKTEQTQEEKGE